jgi:hypothetical protein
MVIVAVGLIAVHIYILQFIFVICRRMDMALGGTSQNLTVIATYTLRIQEY